MSCCLERIERRDAGPALELLRSNVPVEAAGGHHDHGGPRHGQTAGKRPVLWRRRPRQLTAAGSHRSGYRSALPVGHDDVLRTPDFSLLVLRSVNLSGTRRLYEALGLDFVDEQHGSGLKHCSATLAGGLVIEIYPAKDSIPSEKTRLGFVVDDLVDTLDAVRAAGAVVVSVEVPLAALIEDLDGRRIELHQTPGDRYLTVDRCGDGPPKLALGSAQMKCSAPNPISGGVAGWRVRVRSPSPWVGGASCFNSDYQTCSTTTVATRRSLMRSDCPTTRARVGSSAPRCVTANGPNSSWRSGTTRLATASIREWPLCPRRQYFLLKSASHLDIMGTVSAFSLAEGPPR